MKYVQVTPEFKLSLITADIYNSAAALYVTVHDWRQKCCKYNVCYLSAVFL